MITRRTITPTRGRGTPLAIALCSAVACAFAMSPAGAQTMPASAGAADRTFLMKASEANVGEIAAGKMAEEKGNSNAVRLLGKRFVDNHSTNERKLVMLAQQLGVSLPMHPSPEDQATAQRLSRLNGPAFDRAFLSAEQQGHIKTIAAFKNEASVSANPQIVAYAKSSLPVLEEHLLVATDDAQRLRATGMNGGMTNRKVGSAPSQGTMQWQQQPPPVGSQQDPAATQAPGSTTNSSMNQNAGSTDAGTDPSPNTTQSPNAPAGQIPPHAQPRPGVPQSPQ